MNVCKTRAPNGRFGSAISETKRMKILVLIKQVPDSTTTIKIRPDGKDIERTGVKMSVNPFDEFAIELAQQLREKRQDVQQITAIAVGPASAAEALRTALAIGADDAIHLEDDAFAALDDLQVAALVSAVVSGGGYDLIVTGKQEIDLDSGQIGPALAEFLNLPHIGAAQSLELAADGKSFKAARRIEGAEEIVEVALPAVVTCEKGLAEPRYPSLPNLMKAKKKPLVVKKAADVPNLAAAIAAAGGSVAHTYQLPPPRPPGKILDGEPEQAVKSLVKLLREEAKVI